MLTYGRALVIKMFLLPGYGSVTPVLARLIFALEELMVVFAFAAPPASAALEKDLMSTKPNFSPIAFSAA